MAAWLSEGNIHLLVLWYWDILNHTGPRTRYRQALKWNLWKVDRNTECQNNEYFGKETIGKLKHNLRLRWSKIIFRKGIQLPSSYYVLSFSVASSLNSIESIEVKKYSDLEQKFKSHLKVRTVSGRYDLWLVLLLSLLPQKSWYHRSPSGVSALRS